MSKISKEEFNLWKKQPVTLAIYKLIEDEINAIKDGMTSAALILDAVNGQLRLSHLLGEKASYETIISLSSEDINDEEDNSLSVQSTD